MSPTITPNDMAVANPYEYWFEPIRRLDIVVVKAPESIQQRSGKTGDVRFIKRIIGLPREKVEIRLGKVMINDKPLVEPFRKMKSTDDFGPIIVPKNEFFLLGDNRPNS